jgi:calcineurin-like phosphoesterase family protein
MNFPGRRGISLEEWQYIMLESINSRVCKSDQLFILGDFAFRPKPWRPRIRCKNVYLIHGNHDPSISACKTVFGQDKVHSSYCTKVCGVNTYLLHYPCLVWPSSHYGSYHLCGHVHDNRTDYWDNIPELKERRSLDVCPESYKRHFGKFGIFSEDQIHAILSARKGHDPVEWYREQHGNLT